MSEGAMNAYEAGQVVTDMEVDWDDIPTDELSSEESSEESNDDENSEGSVEESEDQAVESASAEDGEEDNEDAEESAEAKEEDSSGKEESDSEDKEGEVEAELHEVKIDGEVEKVSLEELKNNYSGKVAYDKKFSELDIQRKEITAERDGLQNDINAVNDYISELGNKMQNVSMLEGLYEVAALNNIGPHIVKQALIKEILPEINRMSDLNEDQINLEFNKADLDYQRSMQQREAEKMSAQQAQKELQNQVDSVLSKYEIDMDEYKEAEKFLSARKEEVGEVTPELVGDYVVFAKAESRAENLLNNFESGKHTGNEEVFNGVIDMLLQNPDFSDADVNEILTDVMGQAKKEVAEQKINNKQQQKNPKKKKEAEPKMEEADSDDWDDLL